jgi:hypothetical protein
MWTPKGKSNISSCHFIRQQRSILKTSHHKPPCRPFNRMVLCQRVKNIWQSDLVVRKHWTAHINLAQRKTYNINLYRDRIHPSHERLAQRKTYNINLYRQNPSITHSGTKLAYENLDTNTGWLLAATRISSISTSSQHRLSMLNYKH